MTSFGLERHYSRRNVEKTVLSQVAKGDMTPALKKYVKRVAVTVETAYHNGLREGLQGAPPQAEPNQDTFLSQMDGEDPEAKRMVGAALELVLTAYRSGRQIGAVQHDMHGRKNGQGH